MVPHQHAQDSLHFLEHGKAVFSYFCEARLYLQEDLVLDALRFTGRIAGELGRMAWSSVAAGPDGIPRSIEAINVAWSIRGHSPGTQVPDSTPILRQGSQRLRSSRAAIFTARSA
jgi:hypothetical protein